MLPLDILTHTCCIPQHGTCKTSTDSIRLWFALCRAFPILSPESRFTESSLTVHNTHRNQTPNIFLRSRHTLLISIVDIICKIQDISSLNTYFAKTGEITAHEWNGATVEIPFPIMFLGSKRGCPDRIKIQIFGILGKLFPVVLLPISDLLCSIFCT